MKNGGTVDLSSKKTHNFYSYILYTESLVFNSNASDKATQATYAITCCLIGVFCPKKVPLNKRLLSLHMFLVPNLCPSQEPVLKPCFH